MQKIGDRIEAQVSIEEARFLDQQSTIWKKKLNMKEKLEKD